MVNSTEGFFQVREKNSINHAFNKISSDGDDVALVPNTACPSKPVGGHPRRPRAVSGDGEKSKTGEKKFG